MKLFIGSYTLAVIALPCFIPEFYGRTNKVVILHCEILLLSQYNTKRCPSNLMLLLYHSNFQLYGNVRSKQCFRYFPTFSHYSYNMLYNLL